MLAMSYKLTTIRSQELYVLETRINSKVSQTASSTKCLGIQNNVCIYHM